MDSSTPNGIEVTVAAIDGEYLVLESMNDKTQFLWPLAKIPRPLEIGCRLILSLQKGSISSKFPSGISSTNEIKKRETEKHKDKNEHMRKLLEELVN